MILDYSKYIIEKASKGIVNYEIVNSGEHLFTHKTVCPFCQTKIENVIYQKSKKDYPEWLEGSFDQNEKVIQCPRCGWWEYQYKNMSDAILDGIRASDVEYYSAIMRCFEDFDVTVPMSALREQILKTPEIIYNIDAHKMEDLVRSIFADFYSSCSVYSFGKTRDGGRDGLIIDADGNAIILQVKRRTKSDATEGVGPVRELLGASILEDNLKGCIFVSTADHFSSDAQKFANKAIEKKRVEIFDLVDYKEFLKYVDITSKSIPKTWEQLIKL